MSLIVIGLDERCFCSVAMKCCRLDSNVGMSPRCTKAQLEEAGYKTIQVSNEKENKNARFAAMSNGVDSRVEIKNIIAH